MAGETVQAVVFDLDGVLLDSEGWWDEVRRELAADAGRPWPEEATRAMQGMSTAEWSAHLAGVVGVPGNPEHLAATVIDRMEARYRSHLPLVPGAGDVVQRLGSHWMLGVATSSPRRLLDVALESARLAGWFRSSISTEDVRAGKPSPAVYEEVVRRLEVDPQRAVAIEDSSNGLRSAAAAGLKVIAVPNVAYPRQRAPSRLPPLSSTHWTRSRQNWLRRWAEADVSRSVEEEQCQAEPQPGSQQ